MIRGVRTVLDGDLEKEAVAWRIRYPSEEYCLAENRIKLKQITIAKFGCFVDISEVDEPGGCVIDSGQPASCKVAVSLIARGFGKHACPYWHKI